jgi:hypothetical protein
MASVADAHGFPLPEFIVAMKRLAAPVIPGLPPAIEAGVSA